MTDEEKKAIEMIEHIQECNTLIGYGIEDRTILAKALLNLIEKQSKEIEHQKEKRENQKQELAILNEKQKEFNKLVNTVNSYKGQFKRQQKEIEELKADKYGLEEEVQIQAKQLIEIDGNYISKEESEQRERKAYIKGTNDAHELCNKKWEDKIKAKIEEIQKRFKEETRPDFLIILRILENELQSLLEKE